MQSCTIDNACHRDLPGYARPEACAIGECGEIVGIPPMHAGSTVFVPGLLVSWRCSLAAIETL
jgi:hypothetical protein